MPVIDLQLWADDLEDVRIPAIESGISGNTSEINARAQELSDALSANVAATTGAQQLATIASALSTNTFNQFVALEVALKAYADASAQAIRDDFQLTIDTNNAVWQSNVQTNLQTVVDAALPNLIAENNTTISEIETLRSIITSVASSYDIAVSDLLNVVIPTLSGEVTTAQNGVDSVVDDVTFIMGTYPSHIVNIYTDNQLFGYDEVGVNPSPATTLITATGLGFSDAYYDFSIDNVSLQNNQTNTFTYTPPADSGDMPQTIGVSVREGANVGDVLAVDYVTLHGYNTGSTIPFILLSNESHGVPANADGSSPDLTGASTTVEVRIGGVDDTGNWTITKVDSAGITSTLAGGTVTITAMSNDSGYVDITATRAGYATLVRRFSLGKQKSGITPPRSPGRWNIFSATLPIDTATAQAAWDSVTYGPGLTQVEGDQAWFYTGTEAAPATQAVFIFNGTSWIEQTEVIDGNLLVTETITGSKLKSDEAIITGTAQIGNAVIVDAHIDNLSADKITTGLLTADRIVTDNITIRNNGGAVGIEDSGVDSLAFQPGSFITASGSKSNVGYAGLESFPLHANGSLVPGVRYMVSTVGTTDWLAAGGINGTVVIGDEFVAKNTGNGTGTAIKGFRPMVTGVSFLQGYRVPATISATIDQTFDNGKWGVRVRRTNDPFSGDPELIVSGTKEIVYDYDSLSDNGKVVYGIYRQLLLREPDAAGFTSYLTVIASEGANAVKAAIIRSVEFQATISSLGDLQINKSKLHSTPQDIISFSIAAAIEGSSSTANFIVSGKEYIISKLSDTADLTGVGVAAVDTVLGHRFTATANGTTLSAGDQADNEAIRVWDANEVIKGRFYQVLDQDLASTVLTSHGAHTAKRGEIFRATSSKPTTTETTKLLLCREEEFVLEWVGETVSGTGITDVTGSLIVRGDPR